jgi:hypothetical protein
MFVIQLKVPFTISLFMSSEDILCISFVHFQLRYITINFILFCLYRHYHLPVNFCYKFDFNAHPVVSSSTVYIKLFLVITQEMVP